MGLIEADFPSQNGRDTIAAWIYQPVRPARAVVHLIHGLGEHSRRYLRLISSLLDAGCVVVADDHAGHGRTASISGAWGDAGEDAAHVVVQDERTLRRKARALYPDLPYIVFGHSWGSMIARALVAEASEEVDGVILCGIAVQLHGMESVLDREALAAEPDPLASGDVYAGQVFDSFLARCGEGAGPTDWIAMDADVVRDHAADPLNNLGSPFSIRFLRGFAELYDEVNAAAWYDGLPKALPILILAGDQDPVTNYGEGAAHAANRLQLSGHHDVRLRIYPGYRHEIHNEPRIRDDVAAEVLGFVERFTT